MTAALLVASAVNFAILMSERSRAGLIEATGPAMARFVDRAGDIIADPPPQRGRIMPVGGWRQGAGRFAISEANIVDVRGINRSRRMEQRLTRSFQDAGLTVPVIRVAMRTIDRPDRNRLMANLRMRADGPGPGVGDFFPNRSGDAGQRAGDGPPRPPFREVPAFEPMRTAREVILAAQLPDGRWLNASIVSPLPPRDEIIRLGASTFVLFAFVLGAALLVARRLSRPLNDLTQAASRVGAAADPQEVVVRGPSDVRQTLEAFNAMSRRVSQLLREKDVMLGALGHDLRTPLASLRIRLETMEPESERQKAVRTVEETAQLLEDILELARQGRSSEPVQAMDVAILVEDLVEDYAETGAPVSLSEKRKAPVALRPVLFRRLLRNLIDNAVAYGKTARLSVSASGGSAFIRVEDDGPGMSPDALSSATRPFVRGEDSRSRRTGGSGLGLALADAIAKAHGGALLLENRKEGGLAAIVRVPLASV
jgi:signal transduction histidine kinase